MIAARDSQEGTGQSFSEWWEYQRKLCKRIDGADIPAQDTTDAAVGLLAVLVRYGYLEEGSLSLERRVKQPGTGRGLP